MIKRAQALDATATTLSMGCLAHCLLLPLVATAAPVLGAAAEAEWVHKVLVALAIPISIAAFWRMSVPALIAWTLRLVALVGVVLLVLAAAGWPEHEWETPLTSAGALLLAGAHVTSFFLRHGAHEARG